jgi:hypothetical protein
MERLGWKLWAGVTIPILTVLVVEVIAMLSQHSSTTALMQRETADTTAIIQTINTNNRVSFTDYLSGYWTSREGLVRLDFSMPGNDTITIDRQPAVQVIVTAEDFQAGNLEFSLKDHPDQHGWIRKVWNADAVSLEMPGKSPIYLYHYIPLRNPKIIEMKINKGVK